MNIIVTKDYEQMSQTAAVYLLHSILNAKNKRTNIAVTAGKTPKRMYEIISPIIANHNINNVFFYNFDEIPIIGQSEGITLSHLRSMFFDPAQIKDENMVLLNEKNYNHYDQKIDKEGGIDSIVLGLGEDGHFCGNLAGTVNSYDEETHAICLKDYPHVDKRVSRFFVKNPEQKPNYFVTFGVKTVMNCREIIMLASGREKAKIVRDVLCEAMSTDIPASVFRLHPNFTLILDEAAASLYKKLF